MAPKFGYSDNEWSMLIEAASASLKKTASLQRDTNYTALNREIAEKTSLPGFDFSTERGRAGMGELLGDVVDATFDEHRVMLSAVVMYLNDNRPGPGFYALASARGLLPDKPTHDEKLSFWTEQYRRAIDSYKRPRRPHPRQK